MRILQWEEFLERTPGPRGMAASIGVFDGIHRGHQALLSRITAYSGELVPTVFSFRRNPKALLYPASYQGDILSLKQKMSILAALGVQVLVLIDFSGDFSKLAGKDFIGLLQDRGKLRYLCTGSNFRCGYGLDTDAEAIKALNESVGIPTDLVVPLLRDGSPVSSSRIRTAIARADLVEAAELLGRNVSIDVSGAPQTPASGCIAYDVRSLGRITPPDGRYPVAMTLHDDSEARNGVIALEGGRLLLPGNQRIVSVEFLDGRSNPPVAP